MLGRCVFLTAAVLGAAYSLPVGAEEYDKSIRDAAKAAAKTCNERNLGPYTASCISVERERLLRQIELESKAAIEKSKLQLEKSARDRACIQDMAKEKIPAVVILATPAVTKSAAKTLTGDNACDARDQARAALKDRR